MGRSFIQPALALILMASCQPRPRVSDHAEVGERYAHRYEGECSSWIHSFRTGFKYCASPKVEVAYEEPYEVPVKKVDGPVTKEALMARGEEVYGQICVACHGADGKGTPGAFPPLAGAGEFYGSPKKMAGIVINGLSGPITVLGVNYEGVMPPQGGALSDYEIAAVTTYVRNSFGNNDGMVKPDDVKAAR